MDASHAIRAVLQKSNLKWVSGRTIFLARHGSHAYGTNTPTSDEDFKGVAIPPLNYFFGYLEKFEQAEFHHQKDGVDAVVYDLRKFFKLAADCNPSIIEVLFTDPADHLLVTPIGERLLQSRDLFISKKAKHTFSGYAVSQLKRIQTHFKWIKNPPKAPPTRAQFKLPETTVIPQDQLKAAQSMARKLVEQWTNVPLDELDDAAKIAIKQRHEDALAEVIGALSLENAAARVLGFDSNFLELLDRERSFRGALEEWRSYQNWLATRNPARSELEQKYGYDTKHGMHLVRLIRMGREILDGEGVIVKRPDAQELLEIRNGAWPYEDLLAWAKAELMTLDRLYETSISIPGAPNRAKLDELCLDLADSFTMGRPFH